MRVQGDPLQSHTSPILQTQPQSMKEYDEHEQKILRTLSYYNSKIPEFNQALQEINLRKQQGELSEQDRMNESIWKQQLDQAM